MTSFDNKNKVEDSLNTSTMNQGQKQDFLDRQIKHYNAEQAKLKQSKEEYDKLHRQLKLDQRALEVKAQEIAKMKEDEMLKIKKEKKVLEQRIKNA